jgi:translocation and assembly module TamA
MRLRAAVTLLMACMLFGGCAALRPSAADAAAPPPPQVVVQIDAPEALQKLLDTHLDLARLVRVASGDVNEPISESELRRLENATPAQARALLATEGYMNAQVRTERESLQGDGRPRVRVIALPGVRTQIAGVTLQVSGPLGDEAAAGGAAHGRCRPASRFPTAPGAMPRTTRWHGCAAPVMPPQRGRTRRPTSMPTAEAPRWR